jgi:hypothetical protein
MRELPAYSAAVLAGIRAAEVDGRLPAPSADVLGDIFPFESPVAVVPFADAIVPEPARGGEAAEDCPACRRPDSDYIWSNADWRLDSLTTREQFGVHAFMLTPRGHFDLGDLPSGLAADQGQLMVAIERALMAGIDGVARVHLNRWGDGGAHLHWWFIARPVGLLQLRGSHLPTWLDVLPPLPADLVAADVARVVAALGTI